MGRRVLSSVLLVLLVAPAACGLHVETTGISKVSLSSVSPGQQHEDFEQRWVVNSIGDHDETLTSLVASADCQVYVSRVTSPSGSPEALATVRVIGSDAAAIQQLVVVDATSDKNGELRVSSAGTPRKTVDIEAFVRVEVELHDGAQLHDIKVSGKGDVVVEGPETLAGIPVDSWIFQVSGSGDLFLPHQLDVVATELQVRVSGRGNLYLSAKKLSVDSVKVNLDGSGNAVIAVMESMNATTSMEVRVHGKGGLRLLAAQLQTPLLDAFISGSGGVSMASEGLALAISSIGHCEYKVSGAGQLNAGGVSCSHATVTSSGSGNAVVRVVDALSYRISSNGGVYYIDPAPDSITSSTGDTKKVATSFGPGPEPIGSTWYDLPPRQTTHISIHSVALDDQDERDDDAPNNIRETSAPAPTVLSERDESSSQHVGWMLLWAIGIYAAWNHWGNRQRRRNMGRETMPLMNNQPSPVYI